MKVSRFCKNEDGTQKKSTLRSKMLSKTLLSKDDQKGVKSISLKTNENPKHSMKSEYEYYIK